MGEQLGHVVDTMLNMHVGELRSMYSQKQISNDSFFLTHSKIITSTSIIVSMCNMQYLEPEVGQHLGFLSGGTKNLFTIRYFIKTVWSELYKKQMMANLVLKYLIFKE